MAIPTIKFHKLTVGTEFPIYTPEEAAAAVNREVKHALHVETLCDKYACTPGWFEWFECSDVLPIRNALALWRAANEWIDAVNETE